LSIKSITGGAFQDSQGNVIVAGTLVLRLNQDALITGVGQLAPKEVTFVTDASGNVSGNLWANDQLSPSGTVYVATLFDISGRKIFGPENWNIAGSSPISITAIAPSSSSVSYPNAIIQDPGADQTISSGNLIVVDSVVAGGLTTKDVSIALTGASDSYGGLISAAIAALPALGGTIDARAAGVAAVAQGTVNPGTKAVTILLGPYNYTFTQIVLQNSLTITGCGDVGFWTSGVQGTQITQASAGTDLFVLGTAAPDGGSVYGTQLNHFRVFGASTSSGNLFNLVSTGGSGLIYSRWKDLTLQNFGGTGMIFNASPAGGGSAQFLQLNSFSNVKIFRPSNSGNSSAVCLNLIGSCGQFSFYDCVFSGVNNQGFQAAQYGTGVKITTAGNFIPYSANFIGCSIECANVGISVNAGTSVVFDGCHFEALNGLLNVAGSAVNGVNNAVVIKNSNIQNGCGKNGGSGYIVTASGTTSQVWFTDNVLQLNGAIDTLISCTSPANVINSNNTLPTVSTLLGSTGTQLQTINGGLSVTGDGNEAATLTLGSGNGLAISFPANCAVRDVTAVNTDTLFFDFPRVSFRDNSNSFASQFGITNGNVEIPGIIDSYKAVSTAGVGIVPIYGATKQKSETAADTNVLTFTPPAVAGQYRINFSAAVSAQSSATLGWTATYKDSNGSAQAPTNLALFKQGTAAPALTFVAATNDNYSGSVIIDVDNSATAIVVKLTFTGTSFTAKASASIERLQ